MTAVLTPSLRQMMRGAALVCAAPLAALTAPAFAETARDDIAVIAEHAEADWLDGAAARALDRLDEGLRAYPAAHRLHTLRGHMLSIMPNRYREAVAAYDTALTYHPAALDARWAKWHTLLRAGRDDEAVLELERMVIFDNGNPLLPLRMAQELRKLDRLDASLAWYQWAVTMAPAMPAWRLALARARFDVMDGPGARDEATRVLNEAAPGSPAAAAARRLLSVIYGATKERGRRFAPVFTPDGTAADRKEWASIRAHAWRLFEAGRYTEAEPVYRKILALNPADYTAAHELGMTLLALDRCEEAIAAFETLPALRPSDEVYADAFFRIGQCLMTLERWTDALWYFEALHEAAVDFEERTQDAPPKAGLRVLDKKKLAAWLSKAKQHISSQPRRQDDAPAPPAVQTPMTEEELYSRIAAAPLPAEQQMDTQGSLMGRDADFSLFRYVIPANRVMRDDRPTGAHAFIPVEPRDTFRAGHADIHLVFELVSASYDDVPISVECAPETPAAGPPAPFAADRVIMGMGDRSGYFVLAPPDTGWPAGIHRCGFFVGREASAYTHADEVRFRIVRQPGG